MNLGIFGAQLRLQSVAYSESWNIQKFDGMYIPVTPIVISSGNSSSPELFFANLFFLYHFRCVPAFWIPLCIYICYVTCTVILGSVSAIYSSIFKHCSRVYSHIFRTFSSPGILRGIFIIPYYIFSLKLHLGR